MNTEFIAMDSMKNLQEHGISMDVTKVRDGYHRLDTLIKAAVMKSEVRIQIHIMESQSKNRCSVIFVAYLNPIEQNAEVNKLLDYFNHTNDMFKASVTTADGVRRLTVTAPCYLISDDSKATEIISNILMPVFLGQNMVNALMELDDLTHREER